MRLTEEELRSVIREVIRKVQGGWKVYPKKPRKGQKRRKALSKKPHKTYKAALSQLRAVERSKSLSESILQESVLKSSLESAIDNAITKLEMSDISNLKEFMLEIANAESGHNPEGLSKITHYNNNPFQMTDIAIKATSVRGDGSEQKKTRDYREAFKRNADAVNPWKDQDYAEIKSNLNMATMAAAMYIMLELNGEPIGSTTGERAEQWERIYNKEASYIYSDDAVKRKKKTESQIDMYKRKNKDSDILKERREPRKGTGKKPKGSGRRLYTDENPKDTVKVEFRSAAAIKRTLRKKSFKSKSHKRQSQIINLIHQRARAAYKNAKDPKTKERLKRAYEYAETRKEASKRKTQRLEKNK